MSELKAKPFLKWAGGKRQLLPEIRKHYPTPSKTKYIEPFVGGGAVLFDMLNEFDLTEVHICDKNEQLINTYLAIRDHLEELLFLLEGWQKDYYKCSNDGERKALFSEIRNYYNVYTTRFELAHPESDAFSASMFIFLNKTCFNGLYRVNSKGEFNTSFGNYKNPLICEKENLIAVSKALQTNYNVDIFCGDYTSCAKYIDENTFVYLDPPYTPLSKTSSFTSYTKDKFNKEEQLRLAEFMREMKGRGASVLLSNSSAESNLDIYKGFEVERIVARRNISSDKNKRGLIEEFLVY